MAFYLSLFVFLPWSTVSWKFNAVFRFYWVCSLHLFNHFQFIEKNVFYQSNPFYKYNIKTKRLNEINKNSLLSSFINYKNKIWNKVTILK